MDERVDAEGDDQEQDAEDDAVAEFPLGRLEGDRGRDVPGGEADVAAEHHGDADLGDGPGESGQHGDEQREAGFPEHDPAGLPRARAQRQGRQAGPAIDLAQGRIGEADDERQDEEDLADGHGRLGVKQAEAAQGAAPAEKGIEEKADDHGRRGHPGLVDDEDELLAAELAPGQEERGGHGDGAGDEGGQAARLERDPDRQGQLADDHLRRSTPGDAARGSKRGRPALPLNSPMSAWPRGEVRKAMKAMASA